MKVILSKSFTLIGDDGEEKFFPSGACTLTEKEAEHWFVKAHIVSEIAEKAKEEASDVRTGLLKMAEDLGLKINKNWSDDTLTAKIEEAEKAKEEAQNA